MEPTAIALWLNTSCAELDSSVAVAVHKLYEIAPWFFTPLLKLVSYMGAGGILLMAFSAFLIVMPKTRRIGTALLLSLGVGALLTNVVLKPLVYRPRPYTWEGSIYQQYWQQLGSKLNSDYCFPSGHTTAAMAFSTAAFLTLRDKRRWMVFLFVFLMGVSRIYLSVHYFTDILGGIVAGGIGGLLGVFVTRLLPAGYFCGEWIRLNVGKNGKHCR